jgi:hypothetical protein
MPTTKKDEGDSLTTLLLSVYEDGTWHGERSSKEKLDSGRDGGIDMLATRTSDGRILAIEHTLIEPFPGNKRDFHGHFEALALRLKEDVSLRVPGLAIYVNAPVRALPRGSDWKGIGDDVASWLRANSSSFTDEPLMYRCPCSHRHDGHLMLQIHADALVGTSAAFLILGRYGDSRVGDSVEKALRGKLPKLAKQPADRRMLLLQRDQGFADEGIHEEIERLRPWYPLLAKVDEIWIADTAAFGQKGHAAFKRAEAGITVESFTFYDSRLIGKSKNVKPIPP